MDQNSTAAPQLFDIIIIGAGPSGITAAIYAVRKSLKVLLLAKTIGGQAALSGDVENYPGFTMITGADLAAKFREEVQKFDGKGLWIKEGVEVKNLTGKENDFTVSTDQGDFKGKTVLICSGRIPRMLGVPGEKEFLGKGVATCATCDAPLFKDKPVAVVGGGNSALDAAFSLLKISPSVTIINNMDQVRGDSILVENVTKAPNVKILNNHVVKQIQGSQFVESIMVEDQTTKEQISIPVQGIFIEIGWIPSTHFDQLTKKDEKGQIIVDEFCKTSIDGIWAAGDVNNLWGEQIIISAGEGAKAALIIAEHIAKIPHQTTSNVHEG